MQPALATPDVTKRSDYVFYSDATSLDANKNRTLNKERGLPHGPAGVSSRWLSRIPLHKSPYAEGRGPEGPRPDRQPPQRVSLPSRTRIAVDKASIYRIEAGSGCVRQYGYRLKPYETLKVGTHGIPAPCAASPSTPRSILTGTWCRREQGHGRIPERTPARVTIPARGHQPQPSNRPQRNHQYRGHP